MNNCLYNNTELDNNQINSYFEESQKDNNFLRTLTQLNKVLTHFFTFSKSIILLFVLQLYFLIEIERLTILKFIVKID